MTKSEQQASRQVGAMTITQKSELEIEITRVFNAPRRLVFEAHSKPEHLRRRWGPRSTTMTSCETDFRSGGSWRFVLRTSNGQEVAFRGDYHEVVPPERLVQTFEFEGAPPGAVSVETLTFTEQDGMTTLTSISRFDSVEARDGMYSPEMEKGAAETYDRLEELLQSMA